MATYKKNLLTIVINMNDGSSFTVSDTVDCPVASNALASLRRHSDAVVSVEDTDYVVFASNVSSVKVTSEQSEEIPMPEPSC